MVIDMLHCLKATVMQILREKNITQQDLADIIGVTRSAINLILNRDNIRISKMKVISNALNYELVITYVSRYEDRKDFVMLSDTEPNFFQSLDNLLQSRGLTRQDLASMLESSASSVEIMYNHPDIAVLRAKELANVLGYNLSIRMISRKDPTDNRRVV